MVGSRSKLLAACRVLLLFSVPALAAGGVQSRDPKEPVSIRMARSEVGRRGDTLQLGKGPRGRWHYETGFFLLALDRLSEEPGAPDFLEFERSVVDTCLATPDRIETYKLEDYNLDNILTGRLLLRLFRRTGDTKYRAAASTLLRQLESQPRTPGGGFWHKKIYPDQMWLDGVYMAGPFRAEAARDLGRAADLDDIAAQLALLDQHARDARTGLMFHAWDESRSQFWADPKTGCSPSFWARSIGWYTMALVDILDAMPPSHSRRKELASSLAKTLDAVRRFQDRDTGAWYQVIDQGTRSGNYLEASASCMFVYSMARASRKGYIPREFAAAAKLGWEGILRRFVKVEPDGSVSLTGTCAVGGLGGPNKRNGTFEYYVSEPVETNDLKGVAAFILAAIEMERR